jgi:hypothetical protein
MCGYLTSRGPCFIDEVEFQITLFGSRIPNVQNSDGLLISVSAKDFTANSFGPRGVADSSTSAEELNMAEPDTLRGEEGNP